MNATSSLPPPSLATIAATQYRQRQRRAREVMGQRGMTVARAESALRPWLAIACLCGADLPELHELLADERIDQLNGTGSITDGEARALVARAICPRADWVAPLVAARDSALLHHHRLEGLSASRHPPEAAEVRTALANATALSRIAWALAFDPNGKHHVLPFNPATPQKEAA